MNPGYSRLHLIERLRLWCEVDKDHTDTRYWAFTEDEAAVFVGCKLFLHEAQAAPAHRAGRIVSFLKQEGEPYPGRIVFRIENDEALIGTTTSPEGWARWWKAE